MTVFSASSQASKPAKSNKVIKERLVLMPLRVDEADKSRQAAMETALVEGLQQKYEVFSGEQVAQKARAIFLKESRDTSKKECDETKCMQDIAIAFQAELIATANVSKQEDGYFLALSIQNIFDNKVVYSKSTPCQNCNAYQAVEKLKQLSGAFESNDANSRSVGGGKPNDPDAALWAEALKGNTLEDYQIYLDNFPTGNYIPFARARIKKLQEASAAAAEQLHQQAWSNAQQENSEASFSKFLKSYPDSRYAHAARSRIDKLKNDVAAKAEAELWGKADGVNVNKPALEAYINRYPKGRYIAAASAKLKLIKEAEANFKGPQMVHIAGKNFEIGKYEVTQAEWRAVMGSSPSDNKNCGDNCPVENVSWDDTQIFIQKLNASRGKQYRLPTEAEWNYACYGGESETKYCGGADHEALAWLKNNSKNQSQPVGQKKSNSHGVHDMSGNVEEWMNDCWERSCNQHMHRGGSYNDEPGTATASGRSNSRADYRGFFLGFRLARTLP
jgi:hypothetical protein